MSLKLWYSLPCLGLLTAALSGCADDSTPVRIDYHQVGFCNTYTTPGGVRTTRPNEVYVVYKIDAVDNAKRNQGFYFFPARLYVDPAEWGAGKQPWARKPFEMQDWFAQRDRRRYMPNDTSFAQAIGVRGLAPSVISRATKKENAGYSIVEVPTPGMDRPIDQISFKLSYDAQEGDGDTIPADPPIVLNNTNAEQASWPHPENCQDLALDKLASW